jgi:hypothetical protein
MLEDASKLDDYALINLLVNLKKEELADAKYRVQKNGHGGAEKRRRIWAGNPQNSKRCSLSAWPLKNWPLVYFPDALARLQFVQKNMTARAESQMWQKVSERSGDACFQKHHGKLLDYEI